MGLWRLVTTALGNGSCSSKWHRLNFLPPWRAEALGTGVWRGCTPLKAPGEGVASFFLACGLHPQSQQTVIFQSAASVS